MGRNNNDIYLSEDPVLFFDQTHNPSGDPEGGAPEGLTQGSKLQQKLYTEQHISARKMDDLLMFGIQRASRSATQRV